jgi:hypothetical protein
VRLVLLVIVFLVVVLLLVRAVRSLLAQRRLGWRECAIRPSDGAVPISTTQTWRHGIARPDADGMVFRPAGPFGSLLPRRPARSIRVDSVVHLHGVHPSWRQVWSVRPGSDVARAVTSDGVVELAARPTDLRDLIERWRPASGLDV